MLRNSPDPSRKGFLAVSHSTARACVPAEASLHAQGDCKKQLAPCLQTA